MKPLKLIRLLNSECARLMNLGYSREEAACKAVLKYNNDTC